MNNPLRIGDEADAAAFAQDGTDGFDQLFCILRRGSDEHAGICRSTAGLVVTTLAAITRAGDRAENGVAVCAMLAQDCEERGDFGDIDDDFDAFDVVHRVSSRSG